MEGGLESPPRSGAHQCLRLRRGSDPDRGAFYQRPEPREQWARGFLSGPAGLCFKFDRRPAPRGKTPPWPEMFGKILDLLVVHDC